MARALDLDADLEQRLRQSNARFVASISRILERYNHPFEDDLLISMETLTYDTPDGPKQWAEVSARKLKEWKKEVLECNRGSQRNADLKPGGGTPMFVGQYASEGLQSATSVEVGDGEPCGSKDTMVIDGLEAVEAPENGHVGIRASSPKKVAGSIAQMKSVYTNAHSMGNKQEELEAIVQQENYPPELEDRDGEQNEAPITQREMVIDLLHHLDPHKSVGLDGIHPRESPENSHVDTSDIDAESHADMVSMRRKFEDLHFQNPYVDDGKTQEKAKVQVDVIVQDYARKIPKWIMVAPQGPSEGLHFASAVQELIGNKAAVCREKELSNECSSSRPLQSQFSDVAISPNAIAIPRHQPSPDLNKTCYDSILEEYRSADEECSWSNITLADLYPAMVEILTRLMTKQSRRKELKYVFGHFRHKRWCSRRPKLNVTVNKVRGFRPLKLKQALPSICSRSSEDIQNQTFGSENRELCDDKCSINNFSGLVPYSYTDTNETKMDCSDSSLERRLVSGKGQKVAKQTAFPNAMAKVGERLLVEESQTLVSLKNPKCKESEKLAYNCSSEYRFVTSAARPRALHPVKETKPQKPDFPCGDASEWCSSACSSYGNNNTFIPVTNSPLAKASNTLLINREKIFSERLISFQRKRSFSSLSMKQSPSKMPHKYEDAFEKLYYKLCSKEIQKPLTLTRHLSNSQNLEEKGRAVKRNSSDSVRSNTQCDREFDRIYEQACSEAVPKLPGFQRASNLRRYEGLQMSETVNALVNSPVRTLSAIPRVKRLGNFQNDLLCSPVKRLKNIPERYFPSTKSHQISHRKNVNLQTVGTDFLSTYSGNNHSFFNSHSCQNQDAGFRAASDKTFLALPGTSLQGSVVADAHSGWPRAMKNYSWPGNGQKCHQRVSRKLSYTDGKDQNPGNAMDDFMVTTHQGAFVDCYSEDIVL
ncbi:Holliday junction recognition protein [Nyctibius grandis]|uniref:Holliday junction recognition protein n=1 Tax=Nyctibius grandis TaxID=48427 RepID=UPI0035BBC9B5